MMEADLRIMGEAGDLTIVTVSELTSNVDSLPDRVVDAIESEFEGDDDVIVER